MLAVLGTAQAQEAAPAAKPSGKPTTPATAPAKPAGPQLPGEVQPPVYYLPGKDGNLQAVIGWTFDQFIKMYKLQERLEQKDERPAFTLQKLTISGTATPKRAELTVELTVVPHKDDWVQVPLRLSSAALQQVKFSGPGEQSLDYPEAGDGYVSWIRGEAEKPHVLTLTVLVPLTTAIGETQLRLSVPRAVQSQLKLDVPIEQAVATLSDGGTLENVKSSTGKSELAAVGIGGEFQLSWRAPEAQVASVPAVLEATGALLAQVGSQSVTTEARLSVRSFGGPFNQVRVRLPPNSQLVNANPTASVQGQFVDIKLDKKTTGPVEIQLVTERLRNVAQANEVLEFAGFEVVGAVRQWGHIGVQPGGSWQVNWGDNRNVRQVDDPPESLRRDDLAGCFEYYAQPFSLSARVTPQKTRISASPEYVFLAGAQQVELEGRVKYRVRGAKVRNVEIALAGWEIDEVGPPNLVRSDAVVDNKGPTLSIPFVQPLAGEFEITLKAHRAVDADAKTLELELPRALADVTGPATVAMLPADNVELRPTPDAMVGLSPQPLKPQLRLPDRQQEPLYYRGDASAAKFVAGMTVHAQAIAVEATGQIEIDEQEVRVEQRLTYQVSFEPVDKLMILAPASIPLEKLRVSYAGQRIMPLAAADDPAAEAAVAVLMRVPLPSARIGRCELLISYALPQEKFVPATSVGLSVPLVMPGDGHLTRSQFFVSAKSGMTVTNRKGPWRVEESARGGARAGGLSLVADQPSGEVSLGIKLEDRRLEESTIVERAWIQTTLTDATRQDQALFRFITSERRIRVTLPGGVVRSGVEVTLDGKALLPDLEGQGDLSLPIAPGVARREHLLELRYHFAQRDSASHLSLAMPQFKPAVWVRRMYWQLVVPASEHLLRSPADFTREFSWQWNRICWQRQPSLEQPELEAWIGAAPGAPQPGGTNRYLFSGVGTAGNLELWTARRSVLVFAASLLVLAAGLLLIYLPLARHPAGLLAVAVLLAALAAIEPESAVLVAQSAALGVVLVLIAMALARRAPRSIPPAIAPTRGSSIVIRDRSATEMYFRASKGGSHSSTATAPMAVPVSPESKS